MDSQKNKEKGDVDIPQSMRWRHGIMSEWFKYGGFLQIRCHYHSMLA
jgi:hypothetical protein